MSIILVMVLPLKNAVQPYSWGSATSIPELFGISNPDGAPMAEIWMGAHPKAPSQVTAGGRTVTLDRYLATDAGGTLGEPVATRYGGKLPFLFKILAAAEPLSIQAHPSRAVAESGFAREEAAGISRSAPDRNYRDDNHKPELIYALTPFWGMRGFRPPSAIRTTLGALAGDLAGKLRLPAADSGLPDFFRSLMTLSASDRAALIDLARLDASEHWPDSGRMPNPGDSNAAYYWVRALARWYPDDVGVLAPLFLNVFSLRPGEATFQPAGVLHAYLHGTGAELMANSDNVLRGGLTVKHVDLDELLRVGVFRTEALQVLGGVPAVAGSGNCAVTGFDTPFEEFAFSRIDVGGACTLSTGGPQILFCSAGTVAFAGNGDPVVTERGQSVFVRADEPELQVAGNGTLLRATVESAG